MKYLLLTFLLAMKLSAASDLNHKLHAQIVGDKSKPIIFMIHGSPGSSKNFSKLLADKELTSRALLVAIDRPGYGQSANPESPLGIEQQAKLFSQYLIKNFPKRKIILVGHSYGSAIAARMAADKNAHYASLVILSAMADPQEIKDDFFVKKMKSLTPFAESRFVQPFIPQDLLTCQGELVLFESSMTGLLNDWNKIRSKVTILHGENDRRIKAHNPNLIKAKIGRDDTTIRLIQKAGHDLLKKNSNEIKSTLLKELQTY